MNHLVTVISSVDPMLTGITAIALDLPKSDVIGISISGESAQFSTGDITQSPECLEIPGDCLMCGLRSLIVDLVERRICVGYK